MLWKTPIGGRRELPSKRVASTNDRGFTLDRARWRGGDGVNHVVGFVFVHA